MTVHATAVIPAQAGIHRVRLTGPAATPEHVIRAQAGIHCAPWIPARAGMTPSAGMVPS